MIRNNTAINEMPSSRVPLLENQQHQAQQRLVLVLVMGRKLPNAVTRPINAPLDDEEHGPRRPQLFDLSHKTAQEVSVPRQVSPTSKFRAVGLIGRVSAGSASAAQFGSRVPMHRAVVRGCCTPTCHAGRVTGQPNRDLDRGSIKRRTVGDHNHPPTANCQLRVITDRVGETETFPPTKLPDGVEENAGRLPEGH
jgi:hypothetical protein